MKKISNLCCCSAGTNAEEQTSEPQPSGYAVERPGFQIVSSILHDNEVNVKDVSFTPNGRKHRIVISFDERVRTKMKLAVDEKTIYEVDTKWSIRGNASLDIFGLPIFFLWDVHGEVLKFTFRTRIGARERGESSRSGGAGGDGSDAEVHGSRGEEQQFHWLQVEAGRERYVV